VATDIHLDQSNSKSVKVYEVNKNPKWPERGHLESNMSDINFERITTRSQSSLVNFSPMKQVIQMDELKNYA
jgi:hypothetical protein